jgi:hypothetical protein
LLLLGVLLWFILRVLPRFDATIPALIEPFTLIDSKVYLREVAAFSSLQNIGLELSIVLAWENLFSQFIANEYHHPTLLSLLQMNYIIFYDYYYIKLEGHPWTSYSSLATSIIDQGK